MRELNAVRGKPHSGITQPRTRLFYHPRKKLTFTDRPASVSEGRGPGEVQEGHRAALQDQLGLRVLRPVAQVQLTSRVGEEDDTNDTKYLTKIQLHINFV